MQVFRQMIYEIQELTSSKVGLIIFSFAVAAVIALAVTLLSQSVIGGFVRRARRLGATSAESAMTVDRLGAKRNIFVLCALSRSGSALRRVMLASEETDAVPSVTEAPSEEGSDGADEPNKRGGEERGDKRGRTAKRKEPKKPRLKVKAAHWYIPDERSKKAEAIFGDGRTNPVLLIIAFAFLLGLMYLLIPMIPNIIEFAKAMMAA